MITETPIIAFGLTLVVCLSLFFYCWYIRKLVRCRLTANRVQVSAQVVQVDQQPGLEKAVVATFPTVKTHELKDDDELHCDHVTETDDGVCRCPICLVEYVTAEALRKLPLCGHVFHIHCADSWLHKHVTCPVCRIVYHPKLLETVTIEMPQHLLKTSSHQTLGTRDSSESGDSGTDLELSGSVIAAPLQRSARRGGTDTTAIVECERWMMTESFSFGVSSTEGGVSSAGCFESVGRGWPWRTKSWDEVDESATGLAPLTVAPEHCSFEFLPVVTGPGGDYSLTDFHRFRV